MTPLGYSALPVGAGLLALGLIAQWQPVAVLGAGLLLLVLGSVAYILRRPRLTLERAVEPPRVQKGSAAISLISVSNISRRPIPSLTIVQRIGDQPVPARLPRLGRGRSGMRTYRLPTGRRGTFEISPVEIPRADPFGLCRSVLQLGEPQQISVHPRLVAFRTLPTGISRNLEGPSSDTSPQGSITFHRLREYVVGDDLRNVHWPSTARTGQLVVRHNVDTAQPYTVVLLDLDPARYSPESFEEGVDVAASVAVSMSESKAPVQLRTTSGERVGGPAYRDPTAIVDYLTDVAPDDTGTLESQLVLLRRDRGGTALVVVTGRLDHTVLPGIASLRRRFDRVITICLVDSAGRVPVHPGVTVLQAANVAEAAFRWNTTVAR